MNEAHSPQYRNTVSVTYPETNKFYITTLGWECPRCNKINNPFLDQCPCEPPQCFTITSPVVEEEEWDGSWHGLDGPVDLDKAIFGYGSPT